MDSNSQQIPSNSFILAAHSIDILLDMRVDWVVVDVDIEHEFPSDLRVTLLSPSGTSVDFITPSTIYSRVQVHFHFRNFFSNLLCC
jgi:subtilisin-like proprotein convertase family protein